MKEHKNCPHCGYENNRKSALMCGLCGDVFPDIKANIEKQIALASATKDAAGDFQIPKRTDFRKEISENQTRSLFILLLFPVLIVFMGWAVGAYFGYSGIGMLIALAISAGTITLAWFEGDRMILGFTKARQADRGMDAKLINVVEEMSIAAGLPMPEVYVIDTTAANAFATGRSPERAKIAVTQGLVETLNREELQAVVAHEMAHVRNYDIRFMMLVSALVGTVALLADGIKHWMYWGGSGRSRKRIDGGGGGGGYLQVILLVVIILLAILAPFFAMVLQMSISRKREFLADASAVEFTRNPQALASALDKIDRRLATDPLPSANRATQHLFIANPLRSFKMDSTSLLSTHPPMEARIRILKAMV